MVSNRHPFVAREGWVFLAGALLLAALGMVGLGLVAALPLLALVLFLAFLYRDPARKIPAVPLGVVCPADGWVDDIQQTQDPFNERPCHRLTIRMRPFGVYSLRGPIEGKIIKLWSPEADTPAAERRYALWLQTDEGDDIVWAIRSGHVKAKPHCYVQPGERIGQGQRCGFLFLGGTVEVYLPINSRLQVAVGDRLVAGESILATLVHQHTVVVPPFEGDVATR